MGISAFRIPYAARLVALRQALCEGRPGSRRRPRASQRPRRAIRLDQIRRAPRRGRRRAFGRQRRRSSYDNALAETINGLYKAEVIWRRGPWRNFEAVEFATLEWVDWFNNRRLLEPIGNIPPAEAEARYYAQLEEPRHRGVTQTKRPPANPGRISRQIERPTREGSTTGTRRLEPKVAPVHRNIRAAGGVGIGIGSQLVLDARQHETRGDDGDFTVVV